VKVTNTTTSASQTGTFHVHVEQPEPQGCAPIVANITARVLVPLARELAASPPRHAVLSGIRPQEAAELLAAWRPLGLGEAGRIDDEGWTSLRLAAA